MRKIPKLKFKAKPDWYQPETMNDSKSTDYYPSQRAIGRLFREIELPALDIVQSGEPKTAEEAARRGRTTSW
jgi:RNA-dependent RNA polymerase